MTAPIRETDTADREQALNQAYWKLREHASGYRSAKVFRQAMEAHDADPADAAKRQRAMNHEWYARGIEAAARTVAELLGVPEHELAEEGDDPVSRFLMDGLGNVPIRFWACPVEGHSDSRRGADGWPVVTVEWDEGVARCTAEGCGRTSAVKEDR